MGFNFLANCSIANECVAAPRRPAFQDFCSQLLIGYELMETVRSTIGSVLLVVLSAVIIRGGQAEATGVLHALRFEPESIVLGSKGATQRFSVTAVYSDGTETDATHVARRK